MKLKADRALAGILEPVFAIRTETDLGIGDTDGVRQMIDWCHKRRLNIFQMLPITEAGDDRSPYDPLSSLAIDPTLLSVSPQSVPDLPVEKFNRLAQPKLLRELRQGPVNYPKVRALKRALLEAAFDVFVERQLNRGTQRALDFGKFLHSHAGWLPDYAFFRVLMEENGNRREWNRWGPEQQEPEAARAWLFSLPEKKRELLLRKQLFFIYAQWLAFGQWKALKGYAEKRRVYLMGDIPFGVALYSADVWANRAFFDVAWVGGAPPEKLFKVDPFTQKWGQNWGIATYRWEELRRHNFHWWRTRVGNIRQAFHLCRIDHAPGFFRIYSFPWPPERDAEFLPLNKRQAAARTGGRLPGFRPFPDNTPAHQAANQKQGEEILRVVLEAAEDTVVIAEDLGVIPPYIPPTLKKLGIPGFRIPMLFREKDGSYENPAKYPRLSLAQPATHDHPPLAAAWAALWKSIDARDHAAICRWELQHWMKFAGLGAKPAPREFTAELHEGSLRAVLGARSWLAVVMITDIFGLTQRFNTPGSRNTENWRLRLPMTVKQLEEDPVFQERAKSFARMAKEAKRGL